MILFTTSGERTAAGVVLALVMIPNNLSCVSVILHANYRGDLIGLTIVVQSVLTIAGLILVRVFNGGLIAVAVQLWVVTLLSSLFVVVLSRRQLPFRVAWRAGDRRRRGREVDADRTSAAAPSKEPRLLLLTSVLTMVAWKLDLPTAYVMLGAVPAGIYAASYRVLDQMTVLPSALVGVLTPRLSQLHSDGGAERDQTRGTRPDRLAVVTIALASAASIVFWPFAGLIQEVIFGPGFTQSVTLMRLLASALPLICLRFILASLFIVTRNYTGFLLASSVYFVGSLAFTILFTAAFGLKGTATATIVGELLFVIVCVLDPRTRRTAKPYFALAIVSCVVPAVALLAVSIGM